MNSKINRESKREQERISNLIDLILHKGDIALDAGTRDGFLAILLAEHFKTVIALDLQKPEINHQRILPIQGDVTNLGFQNNSFNLVLCAEVLEHIPAHLLSNACSELSRVTKEYLIIGVPYKQDLRAGQTTCSYCGKKNPPWGHINSFDEFRLKELFPEFTPVKINLLGSKQIYTNFVSAFLMDLSGNPYGTYKQKEVCIHCGKELKRPLEIKLWQKILNKIAFSLRKIQQVFTKSNPYWIHILFKKN